MAWRELTREEKKKQKELDEARKTGKLPFELDEDGNEINPHIPTYIKEAPWYLTEQHGKPSLKHQRKDNFNLPRMDSIDHVSNRGKFQAPAATVYREGACQNCGSMTHKVKDCVERPRKIGAKYTGEDICPDETIKSVALDYEGSHDRWNGYEPEMYKKVMEEFEETDLARRKKIAEERAKHFMTEPDPTGNKFPHEAIIDEKKKEKLEEESLKKKRLKEDPTNARVFANNLRVREDTAKYLYNLDPDSAFYDPKSRSMRENPNEGKDDDTVTFTGDNASRNTGEIQDFFEIQKYAWETYGTTNVSAPSEVEILHEEFKRKKNDSEQEKKKQLLLEYGGEEHVNSIPTELIYGQSEEYKEYAPDGTLLPKYDTAPVTSRSRYREDIFVNNHTTVWGSFYDRLTGKWGYKCCQQLVKNAYCIGLKIDNINAILPTVDTKKESSSSSSTSSSEESKEKKPKHKSKKRKKSSKRDKDKSSKKKKKNDKDKNKRDKDKSNKKEILVYREKKRVLTAV